MKIMYTFKENFELHFILVQIAKQTFGLPSVLTDIYLNEMSSLFLRRKYATNRIQL